MKWRCDDVNKRCDEMKRRCDDVKRKCNDANTNSFVTLFVASSHLLFGSSHFISFHSHFTPSLFFTSSHLLGTPSLLFFTSSHLLSTSSNPLHVIAPKRNENTSKRFSQNSGHLTCVSHQNNLPSISLPHNTFSFCTTAKHRNAKVPAFEHLSFAQCIIRLNLSDS